MTEQSPEVRDRDTVPDHYDAVRAALDELRAAEAAAWHRFMAVLEPMSDAELVAIAENLHRHETPSDGTGARVARSLIVVRPILANILASRHFENPSMIGRLRAVRSLNGYLHDLWTQSTSTEREPLERALRHAASFIDDEKRRYS